MVTEVLLTEAYLEMIEGQYLDLSYRGAALTSPCHDYLGMISRKTGALMRCAVNIGAVIGPRMHPRPGHIWRVVSRLREVLGLRLPDP